MRTARLALARISVVVAAVALVAVLAVSGAHAEEGDFEFSSPDAVPLETLLQAMKGIGGLPLMWSPDDKAIRGRSIAGPFEWKGRREELLADLRGILTSFDLVLIPVGPPPRQRMLVADARQTASVLKLKPTFVELRPDNIDEYEGQDGLFVAALVSAPNVPEPSAARNALQRLVTGQNIGSVVEIPPSSYLVTDFAPNVVLVYRTLRLMDAQATERVASDEVRTVRLQHASALELAALLSAQFAPPPLVQGKAPVPPTVRIQGDPRTNTLVVGGPPAAVERVLALVPSLDAPAERRSAEAPATPTEPSRTVDPVMRRLRTLRVTIDVDDATLAEVVETLRSATHLAIVVTPSAARQDAFTSAAVRLHVKDLPVDRVLDLICPVGACEWKVEDGVVYLTDPHGR